MNILFVPHVLSADIIEDVSLRDEPHITTLKRFQNVYKQCVFAEKFDILYILK